MATADAGDELADTAWHLRGIAGDVPDAPDVRGHLALTLSGDGTLAGSTGCNRFTGTWSRTGGALSLRLGAVTLAACADEWMNVQERAYLTALAAVDHATKGSETLTLDASDGRWRLTFEAGEHPPGTASS